MKLLILEGADMNATCYAPRLWSPLQAAAHQGHALAVKVLVDAGADVNLWDCTKKCTSALSIAALKGYTDIVHLLLAAGANLATSGQALVHSGTHHNTPRPCPTASLPNIYKFSYPHTAHTSSILTIYLYSFYRAH